MELIQQHSPRLKARITGVLYALMLITGIFAQGFVAGRLIVSGDAAATANNIVKERSLFELGFTVYLIEMVCNVVVTTLFFELLEPVGRSISLAAACISLVGCGVKTFSRVFYIAALFVLDRADYLNTFTPGQLQSLALLFLRVNDQGAGIALAFFGFYAVLKGYLIFRSAFLPRIIGVLSALSGLGWLTFLSPTLGNRVFPYTAVFGLIAAGAVIFWLVIVGVDEERWNEQALTGLPRSRGLAGRDLR